MLKVYIPDTGHEKFPNTPEFRAKKGLASAFRDCWDYQCRQYLSSLDIDGELENVQAPKALKLFDFDVQTALEAEVTFRVLHDGNRYTYSINKTLLETEPYSPAKWNDNWFGGDAFNCWN